MLRSNFTFSVFSKLDAYHPGPTIAVTSGNPAPRVYPDPVEVVKSTSKIFTPLNNAHHPPTPWPLHTHSKPRKPIPFKGLLHGSLDTGGGVPPRASRLFTPSFKGALAYFERRRAATIPFRITTFADPTS